MMFAPIVLVVDTSELCELFSELLAFEGYAFATFSTVKEAMAFAQAKQQSVVFLLGGASFVTPEALCEAARGRSRWVLATGAAWPPVYPGFIVLRKPFDFALFISGLDAPVPTLAA